MRLYNFAIDLVAGTILLFSCSEDVQKTSLKLQKNWQFRKSGDRIWMKATVPGSVHTDLLDNGIIKDPFYRLNEHEVQWIDKEDWEYQTTFKADKALLKKDVVELKFDGLDTYADVYLNDQLLLSANNMFREWTVDCRKYLTPGANTLRIVFKSPVAAGISLLDKTGYKIPVSDNDLSKIGGVGDKKVSVFLRKAGYHFGWDWGPRLVTSGIWKAVTLQAWSKATIRDVFVRQSSLDENVARLNVKSEVEITRESHLQLVCKVNGEEKKTVAIQLKKGLNIIETPLTIQNPKRWWPNGMGNQTQYKIEIELKADDTLIDREETQIGLRTVEVLQEPDSIGKSFYFKVNDIPTFMKGANYIPQDVFLNRVASEDYERVVKSAADANMNMLRVWGGGIYEKDIFYDLCDRYGILVWQDFMFACAMFPGDEAFLDNVREEACYNVKRLRNHPCIAIWAGNNEILSAWYQWGWKTEVIEEQGQEVADKLFDTYDKLFHHILADIVSINDPDRFYWSSCPQSDVGVPKNFESGDYHYWDVWWGKKPFSNYEKMIPRFMSEFGFQSFPELNTVHKYAIAADWDIHSEVMKSHQRSSIGNTTIEEYLLRHYKRPKDFPMLLYVNHLLQAEGIRIGIEAHRRNRVRCMGSLYWQINDCWPVASWSSTDYYGNWKALHYTVRRSFAKTIISSEFRDGILDIYTITDSLDDFEAKLQVRVVDFQGETQYVTDTLVTIQGNSSQKQWAINVKKMMGALTAKSALAELSLLDGNGEVIGRKLKYFAPPKDLELPQPKVETMISLNETNYTITVKTDQLAKNVYLRVPVDGHFSDNYFDLLPGEKVKVTFIPKDGLVIDFGKQLKVFTLVDTF